MLFFVLVLFVTYVARTNSFDNTNKLLAISFDGFRYDYIDRKITPNIHLLKTKSTSAKFLLNVFPTQTYPNHFSLATGLYSENHGVLGSEIYNPQTKSIIKYSYELWHYNESVLPIWSLNEKAGRTSGVMMWPGSNYDFAGIKTTYVNNYNSSVPWEDRVNKVLNWYTEKKKPANFVMMYFEQPDKDSHAYGPDSPETNIQIQRVDKIVKYIMEKIKEKNLEDLNVILLSDHGMDGVTVDRIIDLRPVVGNISQIYGTSPVLQVYPENGKEEEVYKKLKSFSLENKHFKVYKREEIPNSFHYKKCKRAPPIMVLAEPEYAFQDLYNGIKWYKEHYSDVTDKNTFGVHGYDPDTIDMHPYFIATGPKFKENFVADHLYTVDMYLLFAKVLDLKPDSTDGDVKRVDPIFKVPTNRASVFSIGLLLLFMIGIIFISAIYLLRKSKKKVNGVTKEEAHDENEVVALLEI